MSTTESRGGRAALMVAHCAGMVDLVALPVWVGTLMARYGFDPQQAGALATLFLAGAVTASLWVARRFHRLSCGSARRLDEETRIMFTSATEAMQAGYAACRLCST